MCWAQSLLFSHSVVLKAHEVPFLRRQHQGGEQGPSACWTLDPGLLLLSLVAPREEALMVVDSEKSQGQTQCLKFQILTLVPTLSQPRDGPR